jgi:hypothetical protein
MFQTIDIIFISILCFLLLIMAIVYINAFYRRICEYVYFKCAKKHFALGNISIALIMILKSEYMWSLNVHKGSRQSTISDLDRLLLYLDIINKCICNMCYDISIISLKEAILRQRAFYKDSKIFKWDGRSLSYKLSKDNISLFDNMNKERSKLRQQLLEEIARNTRK